MGGLWCDYERNGRRRPGDRLAAQPADQHPGHLRHRRVRLPVPRRQPAGGQLAGGLHLQRPDRGAGRGQLHRQSARRHGGRSAVRRSSSARRSRHQARVQGAAGARRRRRIPIGCTRNWAGVMTEAATVVRHNDELDAGLRQGLRAGAAVRARARCPTPATGPIRTWSSPGRCRTCSRWPRRSSRGAGCATSAAAPTTSPSSPCRDIDGHRPGRAPPPGRGVVRPVRGEQPQVAQDDDRRARRRRRAAIELRRRRHVADPAAPAAVRRGRRRRDRRSLEAAPSSPRRRSGTGHDD